MREVRDTPIVASTYGGDNNKRKYLLPCPCISAHEFGEKKQILVLHGRTQ